MALRPSPVARGWLATFFAVIATFFLLTPAAWATVRIENEMQAEWVEGDQGVRIYPYGSGSQHVADFSTGTHSGTVNNGGSLELGGASGDWWDTAWKKRQCFDVKSTDAVAEYPLRFEVDTSSSTTTGDDIRVIDLATNTVLTSYSEGLFPDSASIVWAQAEPLPAGVSSYCIYFDNSSASSVSDEVGTFTYTSGQVTKYYTMLDTYNGNGVDSQITVYSYGNNNVISDGTATVTLQTGQSHTFSGLDKDSVITATGPISAGYDRQSRETLLPEGYADTQFAFPTSRYTERFWIRSPNGNTTVEAVANGAVIGSVNVGPGSGSVELIAAGTGNQIVSLRSTNGTDFLAMHSGTNDQDIMIGVPWFNDALYGVGSQNLNMGAFTNTTVSWLGHDGSAQPAQAVSMNTLTVVGGNGASGNGRAYAITGTGTYFHAAQQADRDGTEVTSFLPRRLLSQTYRVPVATQYYSIACPIVGTQIKIDGVVAGTCNGTGVGFFYSGFGNHAAGTLIEADHPVFVYYETFATNDEHNLHGPKSHIPYLEEHKFGPKPVEKVPATCGVWLSNVLPTSGVFGLFNEAATLPTDTTATYQLSTDGSAFYGPDGTAATSFADGDIIPYLADGATTLQFRIELCTNDVSVTPSVSFAAAEYNLVELVADVTIEDTLTVSSPPTAIESPLLRIYQDTPGAWQAWVEYVGGTSIASTDVVFTTDTPTTQVGVSAGSVTDPRPAFVHGIGQPYSLIAAHQTVAGQQSTVRLMLVEEADVRIENQISIDFVG